jgi:hypothetical protein
MTGYSSAEFAIGVFPESGIVLYFGFVGDGSLSLDDIYYFDENENPQVLLNDGVIPRDEWIKIEANLDMTTDPYTMDISIEQLDETVIASGNDLTVLTNTNAPLYRFVFGNLDNTGAGNITYVDHIKIEEV